MTKNRHFEYATGGTRTSAQIKNNDLAKSLNVQGRKLKKKT